MSIKINPDEERDKIHTAFLNLLKAAEDIRLKLMSISASKHTQEKDFTSYEIEHAILEAELNKLREQIKELRTRFNKLPK